MLVVDGLSDGCFTCYFLTSVGWMIAVDGECGIDKFEKIDEKFGDFIFALCINKCLPTL